MSDRPSTLRSLRLKTIQALTKLQHISPPFINAFLLVHLSAPLVANVGGSHLSSQVMVCILRTRYWYPHAHRRLNSSWDESTTRALRPSHYSSLARSRCTSPPASSSAPCSSVRRPSTCSHSPHTLRSSFSRRTSSSTDWAPRTSASTPPTSTTSCPSSRCRSGPYEAPYCMAGSWSPRFCMRERALRCSLRDMRLVDRVARSRGQSGASSRAPSPLQSAQASYRLRSSRPGYSVRARRRTLRCLSSRRSIADLGGAVWRYVICISCIISSL